VNSIAKYCDHVYGDVYAYVQLSWIDLALSWEKPSTKAKGVLVVSQYIFEDNALICLNPCMKLYIII